MVLGAPFGEFVGRWNTTTEQILRAKHLLKMLGLKKKLAYPYDSLSYGQQQRVLLARALMVPPKLLVLDEPCSGLDVLTRKYFLNTVAEIANTEGTTIICATHYTEEILPCFSKGILMKDGKIFSSGDINSIFQENTLNRFFDLETSCTYIDNRLKFDIAGNYFIPKEIWL